MKVNALGVIFSNKHDEALAELTARRTMASVPFGGRYRLIDFVLSNLYNAGIKEVGVITRNNYQSLIDHLGSGKEWDLSHKREGLYILPPFSRSQSGVYKNRISALADVLEFLSRSRNENVILCDCDTVCNLDLREPLGFHQEKGADITAIYRKRKLAPVDAVETVVYTADQTGRATDIRINPKTDGPVNAGVNMWIARKSFLEHIVADADSRGIESWNRGVLMRGLRDCRIFCWEFTGHLGVIHSMGNYFKANMELLRPDVKEDLFYRHGHIYTKVRDEAPAKYGAQARVRESLIADGCTIEGNVENSVLFRGVHIGRNARITNSIVMQASRIEDNVKLNYVIIDKNVTVKNHRVLMGYDTYPLFIGKGSVV